MCIQRGLLFLLIGSAVVQVAKADYLVNWEEAGEEALNHLSELIKINTVNPPGNETEAARYVQQVLEPTWSPG